MVQLSHPFMLLEKPIFDYTDLCQQTDGETMETVTDFIFLGSKSLQLVTANMKLKDT